MEKPISREEAKRIIEAALFASPKPLLIEGLNKVLRLGNKAIREIIEELKNEYAKERRSFQIVEIAQGFQICTLPLYAPWLKRIARREREEKLSAAALETLSIIAYRQPVTRADIEVIRGVEVGGILRLLTEKKLIRIAGRKETLGRPLIYRTTSHFLQYFGLRSLSDLPKLEKNEREKIRDTSPRD
ncbi:MAG: SMC-Scp complex subunit ScpB [Candidatus Omnitrophica bacterium]|nr:SMC-Scp complex subunit ScpB [Candidatus Omnitrophota bacterium]